jgi:hypothetical protein
LLSNLRFRNPCEPIGKLNTPTTTPSRSLRRRKGIAGEDGIAQLETPDPPPLTPGPLAPQSGSPTSSNSNSPRYSELGKRSVRKRCVVSDSVRMAVRCGGVGGGGGPNGDPGPAQGQQNGLPGNGFDREHGQERFPNTAAGRATEPDRPEPRRGMMQWLTRTESHDTTLNGGCGGRSATTGSWWAIIVLKEAQHPPLKQCDQALTFSRWVKNRHGSAPGISQPPGDKFEDKKTLPGRM